MKITIEKAEAELAELKEAFELADARIGENGGQKSQHWIFMMRHRIYKLEKKIEDMKANKVRTDKKTPEDIKLEKRIEKLEQSIDIIEKGK